MSAMCAPDAQAEVDDAPGRAPRVTASSLRAKNVRSGVAGAGSAGAAGDLNCSLAQDEGLHRSG